MFSKTVTVTAHEVIVLSVECFGAHVAICCLLRVVVRAADPRLMDHSIRRAQLTRERRSPVPRHAMQDTGQSRICPTEFARG